MRRELKADEVLVADLNETEFMGARILISGERSSGKSALAERFAKRWSAPVQNSQPHAQLSGLCDTVAEEIALGLETTVPTRDEMVRRVEDTAESLGISHLLEKNPLELSGGQSQLTVLACYLAMNPRVWVIDEPLTGLDDSARSLVLQVFENFEGRIAWTATRPSEAELQVATHHIKLGKACPSGISEETRQSLQNLLHTEQRGLATDDIVLKARDLAVHPAPSSSRSSLWSKRKKKQSAVLSSVNIELGRGEILAIQGANGAGKSTLLRTLAGLISPQSGDFSVAGKHVQGLPARERVTLVSLAAQHPAHHFLARTVSSELSLGPAGESSPELRDELLNLAGLSGKKEVHPHDLSPVEQHLLAAVTAVAARPAVLLLDEPTARLDSVGVKQIAQLVQIFCATGGSVAVATHDDEFLGQIKCRALKVGE